MDKRDVGSQRFHLKTESARERDVFRHLHPWLSEHRCEALHHNAFPAGDSGGSSERVRRPAKPCPDTNLIALAQLTALRLRARRCFVTLVSSSVEYVLAEASRTTSLQYSTIEDVRDIPWLGSCSFLRENGMTAFAIDKWRRARSIREVPSEDDFYHTEGSDGHSLIVSDIRREEQYAQRGFIKSSPAPGVRFYASIPLRASTGSVLGSLTIVDDVPRFGLSAGELTLMEDIADTITEHLDSVIVRSQRMRSERLIISLGLFNSGKKSLRQWYLKQEDNRLATSGRHKKSRTAKERRDAGTAEFGAVHGSSSDSTGVLGVPPQPHDEAASGSESGSDMGGDPVTSTPATLQNTVASVARDKADVSSHDFGPSIAPHAPVPQLHSEPQNGRPGHRRRVTTKMPERADFSLEDQQRRTYGRASNLMRQALGANGVVVVNATTAHTKKRSNPAGNTIPSFRHENSGSGEKPSVSDNETSDGSATGNERHCPVEAFSTRDVSSLNGLENDFHFDLTDSYLALLIKRYPNGKIFNFSPDGSCYSSSGEENTTSGSNSESASNPSNRRIPRDGRRLGNLMVDAKTIAFYPIWDEGQDRWSSAMFVWCTSPLRYFDQTEDLTYLASWSHCIQAELSRLQTIASDQAKGSFISSVSHELRSPLHGILAGVEFLEETELTAFQTEMKNTVKMAGKALLDTIDHILDYAKISSFTRAQTRRRIGADASRYNKSSTDVDSSEIGVTAAVDLGELTEQVVETVVNAHRFQQTRKADTQVPSVAVNIEWRDSWIVELQPGSWTRILANLVGNALKYTDRGLITVRLESEDTTPDSVGFLPIRLIVQDTGIGMTKQFLSHDAYTPFRQANPHSSGTGLGLSIVRRICKDSGATLNIESEIGAGTTVTVTWQVRCVAEPVPSGSRDLNVGRFHWFTPGRSAQLTPRSIAPSVTATARDWLNCQTSQGPICEDASGNVVYAIAEEDLFSLADLGIPKVNRAGKHPSHILILGSSIRSVSFETPPMQDLPFTPIFVHQPIGPRKLLRVIAADQSSTEMGIARPRREVLNPLEYEVTKPLSLGSPPAGYLPSRARLEQNATGPGLSTDDSASSSAVFSTTHPSGFNSVPTERSSSIDSTAWNEIKDHDSPRDTVLLVEDNEVNMKLLMALMRKLKHPFKCAVNGREAVDIYRRDPLSILLVLMDISMPVMDGFAATVKIRETERRQKLPRCYVAALTGVTSEEAKHTAFTSGIDKFYSKPVGMVEIRELMSKLQDGDDPESRQRVP